ncbi:DUF202 domain-containing protein [Escherichia coli]
MPDSRKARRIANRRLQPERTSLAWFRTMLGYGALMVLAIRQLARGHVLLDFDWRILAIVALILGMHTVIAI